MSTDQAKIALTWNLVFNSKYVENLRKAMCRTRIGFLGRCPPAACAPGIKVAPDSADCPSDACLSFVSSPVTGAERYPILHSRGARVAAVVFTAWLSL
jgi:hypothetical protein